VTTDPEKSLGEQESMVGRVDRDQDDTHERSIGEDDTRVPLSRSAGSQDIPVDVVDLADRYQVERTLGQGGMGRVDLATDRRLGRKVAIKRIIEGSVTSRAANERFMTEAKAIASLNHPNIVHINDFGWAKDGPFLVMEYIDGGNLLERCLRETISVDEAIEITCQLCDGLSKAHACGIVHRDIKPANILLTRDGVPKLTDFGLAKAEAADTGMTMAGAVLGTMDFMPPEQRRDAALTDARSDLWSLAATLYQIVTGESPRVIRIRKVPSQLQDVLDKALEDSRDARYQSARELKEALRGCLKTKQNQLPQVPVDLGAGECPSCRSLNESHRKFCRECGEPLRCKCLQCQHEIPVWDKVCPECGAKQAELAAKLIDELGKKRELAEKLRSEFSFEAAIALAKEVSQVEHRRTAVHRDWAVEFAEATGQEQVRQVDAARLHFKEAKKHRDAFDYDAAIQSIELIPEPLRSPEQRALLARLESERNESAKLLESIKNRMQNHELEELLPLVEKAVSLLGDREDLKKLAAQLKEREQKQTRERDEAFQRAENLLSEGNAREALKAVKPIYPKRLTPTQNTLLEKLERIGAADNELRQMIQRAKADGVIDAEEIVALLPKTIEYIRLNPNNQGFLKLKDDLLARLGNVPVELLRNLPMGIVEKLPANIQVKFITVTNSIGMQLKLLPPGTFMMSDAQGGSNERPHQVTLTKPFYIGVHEVTQEQYKRVMGKNPSYFRGANKPVEKVSWEDAVEFCKKLSELLSEKAAGCVYRLPTEAEWEYACRAGSTTKYSFGDDSSILGEYAWYDKNSGKETHPVGEKNPNAWGLYDMHGNVWEWCSDWYSDYPRVSISDPMGPRKESRRVLRGGGWLNGAADCQSANRGRFGPSGCFSDYGFRVALSPLGI
jgi:formylglycine-generating enzyme required for sulfatase activity